MRAAPRAASVWPSKAKAFQRLHPQPPNPPRRAALSARSVDNPIAKEPDRRMDRIVHKADFERVLATRSRSRSTHFALHHVPSGPTVRTWTPKASGDAELSTDTAPVCPQAVDDPQVVGPSTPGDWWIGCVVPKRHAKRAVTRNLLKRQIRSAFERLHPQLPAGLWLVRLRAPFAKQDFISAKSSRLAAAARTELETLLARALG